VEENQSLEGCFEVQDEVLQNFGRFASAPLKLALMSGDEAESSPSFAPRALFNEEQLPTCHIGYREENLYSITLVFISYSHESLIKEKYFLQNEPPPHARLRMDKAACDCGIQTERPSAACAFKVPFPTSCRIVLNALDIHFFSAILFLCVAGFAKSSLRS
jgi:hypothetical protein